VVEIYLIHIEWAGPYSLDQLAILKNEDSDYGVYQIYGGHPIYGSHVLLYIGKADQQTFGVRIGQEGWHANRDAANVQIYIGRLAGGQTPSEAQWSRDIDLAEKILIFAHGPAANARSLSSIPDALLQHVHVLNWGQHRDLMPEVSGARYTSKYDIVPGYHAYRVSDIVTT
jgi:hypothetical protein